MIGLLVALPLAGAVLVAGLRWTRRGFGAVAVAALLLTLLVAVWLVASDRPELVWRWSDRLTPRLALDGFGRVMAVLVPAVAAPVVAYAAADREEPSPARLLGLMLVFVAAMELLVLAEDLLSLLFAWELVGALSWALIAHQWRDAWRVRAARQAFLTTRFGDLGLYLAAGAAYAAAGSLDYAAVGGLRGTALHVVAAGVLLAAAAKSAQLPFSPWLFSAMAGPTPVSALLHSATLVAAGAYALIRLGPALAPTGWFGPAAAAVGLATALTGGIVAASQTDLKRALAGSTSSQYGLVFLAVGAGSTAAAGAHLVTHAAFKSLLFLGAGVAIHATGSGELGRMRLGRALPGAAALFAVGALALAAVPPLGGAWSKEEVLAAAFGADSWLGLATLLSGGLTAFYAARLFLLAYGPATPREVPGPGRGETVGLAALAVLSVLLSLLWLPQAGEWVERAAAGRLPEGEPWEFAAALLVLAVALAAAWRLWQRDLLLTLGLPVAVRSGAADWLGLPAAARMGIARPVATAARALARFDDRVVDAGVRAAVSTGRQFSRLLNAWGERGIEGAVWGVAGATLVAANVSRVADDRGLDAAVEAVVGATVSFANLSRAADDQGLDAAVEAVASGVGIGGSWSRRLQTGMAHHYYVIVAIGVLGAVAITMFWR